MSISAPSAPPAVSELITKTMLPEDDRIISQNIISSAKWSSEATECQQRLRRDRGTAGTSAGLGFTLVHRQRRCIEMEKTDPFAKLGRLTIEQDFLASRSGPWGTLNVTNCGLLLRCFRGRRMGRGQVRLDPSCSGVSGTRSPRQQMAHGSGHNVGHSNPDAKPRRIHCDIDPPRMSIWRPDLKDFKYRSKPYAAH